jgi:hypothetical protein
LLHEPSRDQFHQLLPKFLRFDFRTSIAFIDMGIYCVRSLLLVPLINEIKFAYQTSQFQFLYPGLQHFNN